MEYTGFIILTGLYILAFLISHRWKIKSQDGIVSAGNIIASAQKYTINIIEDDTNIDYSEFADITFNLSDLVRQDMQPIKPTIGELPEKILFKDINFSTLINVTIK